MNKKDLLSNPHFTHFVDQVRDELQQLRPSEVDVKADLEREYTELVARIRGWKQSLGDPNLSEILRRELQADWERDHVRMDEIQQKLHSLASHTQIVDELVNPELVAEHVLRLSETLSGENASAMNVLLAQHIAGIYCDQEGNIRLRTSKLGAFPDALEFLPLLEMSSECSIPDTEDLEDSKCQTLPRRRTRRNVSDSFEDEDVAMALNDFAVDTRRFQGLGPEWFSVTEFRIPEEPTWREAHAQQIAEWRIDNAATMEETANHFGKTVPTIRAALREAKEKHGINATGKEISLSNRKSWARDHATEVAKFLQQPGTTIREAARHFGKSEPTISKARKLATTLKTLE
ncbi:hypothetical protein [Thalassoglobus polymorphus]|uniref:Uncharacterized protein n=1 Tax=Thalassoglobus polymorphus TaxID=2527994 RepID=A0A517QK43_9PLAN|nr:hypothetical protein [Thalassoglobus polymorphus]QDT32009.1 hypothetical protein Mal48_12480 [Thalassoglobus polymorphus]